MNGGGRIFCGFFHCILEENSTSSNYILIWFIWCVTYLMLIHVVFQPYITKQLKVLTHFFSVFIQTAILSVFLFFLNTCFTSVYLFNSLVSFHICMFTNLWYKGSFSVQMHLTVLRCEALSCHFTLADDYELRMSDGLWTRVRQEIRERTRGSELREGNRLGKNNIKLGLWWVPYGLRGHLPARLNSSESAVSDLGLSTAASLSLPARTIDWLPRAHTTSTLSARQQRESCWRESGEGFWTDRSLRSGCHDFPITRTRRLFTNDGTIID